MNKIIRLFIGIFFLATTLSLNAQRKYIESSDYKAFMKKDMKVDDPFLRSRAEAEVFYPSFFEECGTSFTGLIFAEQWGFVSGTNGFGDLEKAQMLTFEDSEEFTVIGAAALFGTPSILGDGEIRAKVYNVNADGTPGDLVSTSEPLKLSQVTPPSDTSVEFTFFFFSEQELMPINNPNFLLSIDMGDLYDTNDTLWIWQTNEDCGDGTDTWELFSDGLTWANFVGSYDLNADLGLGAVVQFADPTSVDKFVAHNGIQLYPAMPNPAQNSLQIKYGLEDYANAQVDIYSMNGKKVKTIQQVNNAPGLHVLDLDISSYSSGAYIYQVTTNKGTIASKFIKE